MKKPLLGLLLALLVQNSFAQKAPFKFGDVPQDQIKMTTYAADTSAAAVVLGDFGESSLQYMQQKGFYLSYERVTRIKILKKDGLKWADFSIPLYHAGADDEKLSGLKGITYNLENGKVVETKLKSESIFKEKYDDNLDLTKVSMPNVKVGSVVEITYKVTSDFFFNFQDWEFQYEIPVVWSEYRARIPEYFHYEKYTQGYVLMAVNDETTMPASITLTSGGGGSGMSTDKIDYQEHRYRWAAQNVPAFKEEPFMTTSKDYISKIKFELGFTRFPNSGVKQYMGTWEDINKTYNESESFGRVVRGNNFLKKEAEAVTAGMSTPEQQIAAIHTYVRDNIMWDGHNRTGAAGSLRKVLDDKKGTSADINLLMGSMLEKMGFTVAPVLVSTRDHGFVREGLPISSQFNGVVIAVTLNDKTILLDATEKLLPTGQLPERYLNGNGFLVSPTGYRWVKLTAQKSRTVISAEMALDAEGALKGKLTFERTGYHAMNSRKRYISKGEADYVKDLLSNNKWQVNKTAFTGAKMLSENFKETHEVEVAEHTTVAGDVIYLNPMLYAQMTENPYKLEKREYPVDFGYAYDYVYMIQIQLPEGYVADELPKPKLMTLPENGAKFSYNITINGNKLSVTSNLQMNRSLFSQDEYPNLREFYAQVVAKQAEQVVLKKQ